MFFYILTIFRKHLSDSKYSTTSGFDKRVASAPVRALHKRVQAEYLYLLENYKTKPNFTFVRRFPILGTCETVNLGHADSYRHASGPT